MTVVSFCAGAQMTPVGTWQTIDDNTQEAKAEIQIADAAGVLNGRILKSLRDDPKAKKVCSDCKDDRKDQAILGMEIIRGVNSDGTIAHLLNKGLIRITGRKEVPGRPFLYGTTKEFLEYFGLKSLEDLPKIENLPQLSEIETIQQADIVAVQEALTVEQETAQAATQESSGQSRVMQEENSASSPNALVGDPEGS